MFQPLLLESRLPDAYKMRTNTFPTRTVLARTGVAGRGNVLCRKCGLQDETLEQVLGYYMGTKPQRIKRHDDIKMLLANELSLRNRVLLEQTFVLDNGERLRPDLVVQTNEDQAYVVDVTVIYENGSAMINAPKGEINKYDKILNEVKRVLKVLFSGFSGNQDQDQDDGAAEARGGQAAALPYWAGLGTRVLPSLSP
ncbi:hypothetical protein QAD02_010476 [Eretmocerus hayati]|uniref:Uncharacterized protein n=1 Tax=Eretmocerus hayati TaxID=131215 RepID=A0ACC2NU11_9HYME|nr:hypothetical protein QAD02_010476 [Eretmocerus hayati]